MEIIANDQGNRTTPSYVAFTDTERLLGDAAKNQVAMNPHNTVFGTSLSRERQDLFSGARSGDPSIQCLYSLNVSRNATDQTRGMYVIRRSK